MCLWLPSAPHKSEHGTSVGDHPYHHTILIVLLCRLLPSILLLPSQEAIRYLEFALDQLQCKEQAIHHQLILLHAGFADSTADARLLTYLQKYTSSDLSEVFAEAFSDVADADEVSKTLSSAYSTLDVSLPYDPGFAIRIAMEKGCLRSTVFLLQSLGLFIQAIEEALSKVMFSFNTSNYILLRTISRWPRRLSVQICWVSMCNEPYGYGSVGSFQMRF